MFIHTVRTPRNKVVDFGQRDPSKSNQISLLTGPNGVGKTDVLATIAAVLHGEPSVRSGGEVTCWTSGFGFRQITGPSEPDDYDFEPIRLIAQTFSPFSRFPPLPRLLAKDWAPVYEQRLNNGHEYSCVGFNTKTRLDLRNLAFSIIENGVLRLSERPATAKVAFDVLEDLEFKDGISFTYASNKYLSALIDIADVPGELERVLAEFASSGDFIVGGQKFKSSPLRKLRRHARHGRAIELAEYLRHAIHMIEIHNKSYEETNAGRQIYFKYSAFQHKDSMSSDFAHLQAFSILSRLDLIQVIGCELTPIGKPKIDLTKTSSGQQQMLCSIFGLASSLDNNAIVLIDEPELSLHPRWQMNYFKYLESALDVVRDCHVIIATHSPIIAQGAANHDVKVVSMDSSSMQSTVSNTEGNDNSVEEMLIDVFDTPIPSSLHISNEVFDLVTLAESGSGSERAAALAQLKNYLFLYQRQGEGARDMAQLLSKAVALVEGSQAASA